MRWLAWAGLSAAVAVATGPAALEAQTCIGVPIGPGQFSIAGDVGFPEGAKTYSGIATGRIGSGVSLQARIDYLKADDAPPDVDDSVLVYGGQFAYVLAETDQFSVCPFLGARYFSEEEPGIGEVSVLQIPIGAGIGLTLPFETVDISVFATPQLLYSRGTMEILGVEVEEDSTDFGTELGGRLNLGLFYLGASVIVTSVEGSEAEVHIAAGFTLGR